MARNYTPQGSYKDIQVLSPTAVVDTMVLTAYTRPSNIYYEVNVPMEAYNAGSGPEYLDTTALGLENLAASPDVRSVHFTTDLDNSGLIVDSAVATVGITPPMGASGPFTTEVQFALGILASDPAIYEALVPPAIAAAAKQLEDLAAS
jgi:hypothetical protein